MSAPTIALLVGLWVLVGVCTAVALNEVYHTRRARLAGFFLWPVAVAALLSREVWNAVYWLWAGSD